LSRLALVVLALGPLACGGAAAREVLPGQLAAEVVEVVDGDTLGVRVHVWLGQQVETRVRILGIDAPELRARCADERAGAEAARDALRRLIGREDVVLRDISYDKYGGRVLAHVETRAGADLGGALLAAGLVRSYRGGRRDPWCGAQEPGEEADSTSPSAPSEAAISSRSRAR
jgi:endonuclease YncB( thermonuclease family)